MLIFSIVFTARCMSQHREAPARCSLPLPGTFTAVSRTCCRLYPPIRLGNRDLISELGLLRWSDMASDYSNTPIPPSGFSPLRRGSSVREAMVFIKDCSIRTWGAERGGRKRALTSRRGGDQALEDN